MMRSRALAPNPCDIAGYRVRRRDSTRLALSTCARLGERAACFRIIAGELEASVALVEGLVGAGQKHEGPG